MTDTKNARIAEKPDIFPEVCGFFRAQKRRLARRHEKARLAKNIGQTLFWHHARVRKSSSI